MTCWLTDLWNRLFVIVIIVRCLSFPQVTPNRTCFNFVADRWFPCANTSISHLLMIREYSEYGTSHVNIWTSMLSLSLSVNWSNIYIEKHTLIQCLAVFTGMQKLNAYNAFQLFQYHICQVCGSFQCPYCEYYNAAPRLTHYETTVVMLLMSLALAIVLSRPFFAAF